MTQWFQTVFVVFFVNLLLSMLGGCALLNPGGQVRQGLEQRTLKEWRADGGFLAEAGGTQTERYTMAQGRIVMKDGPEGEPVIDLEKSVLEYYLTADPSANVAGTAMDQAFAASTRQAEVLSQTISELVAVIAPLIAPVPAPGPEPVPGAGGG